MLPNESNRTTAGMETRKRFSGWLVGTLTESNRTTAGMETRIEAFDFRPDLLNLIEPPLEWKRDNGRAPGGRIRMNLIEPPLEWKLFQWGTDRRRTHHNLIEPPLEWKLWEVAWKMMGPYESNRTTAGMETNTPRARRTSGSRNLIEPPLEWKRIHQHFSNHARYRNLIEPPLEWKPEGFDHHDALKHLAESNRTTAGMETSPFTGRRWTRKRNLIEPPLEWKHLLRALIDREMILI